MRIHRVWQRRADGHPNFTAGQPAHWQDVTAERAEIATGRADEARSVRVQVRVSRREYETLAKAAGGKPPDEWCRSVPLDPADEAQKKPRPKPGAAKRATSD